MGFVQVIEFQTSDLAAFESALDEWVTATEGIRTVERGTLTADRDRPGTYLQIVDFPSYDAAMANSEHPTTSAFAQRLQALCDGDPVFRNLDVVRVDDF